MAENNSNSDAYSPSAIVADKRDNTAVSQRVLGIYQTQISLGLP